MLDTIINREYFIKKGIEVYINDMKSGKTLFSRNYSICNALVFSDGNIAALAHISNATSPEILLSGYVNDLLINNNSHLKKIKSINEIFRGIEKLSVYHIYRIDGCWSDHNVIRSLNDIGIKKTISIPINNSSFRTRDIGVSMKNHIIYIFPRSYSEEDVSALIIPIIT